MEWRISKKCTEETFRNAQWDGKRARLEEIKIPTYITGSWSSDIHTMGSIRGYL
jgi:predicted acyl esterase